MTQRFCEVALPIPLRSTFTYAVPDACNGEELVGRRMVVPFRNRAMVGVCLATSHRAPESAEAVRIREVAEILDSLPALPHKLIELGHWISRYYFAPVGETFRAILPPEAELREDREYWLSDTGRAHLEKLAAAGQISFEEAEEQRVLRHFDVPQESALPVPPRGRKITEAAVEKLVRRSYLGARVVLHKRRTRMNSSPDFHRVMIRRSVNGERA